MGKTLGIKYFSLLVTVVVASSSAFTYSEEDFDYDATFGTDTSKCTVEGLSVKSLDEIVTSLSGLNCDNDEVNSLVIENQEVIFWPKGLESIFNSLTNILLSNSKLSSIQQSDLKPFNRLKELDLSNNDITILDSNLFEFNLDIQHISFKGNKIVAIGENIFHPLKQLLSADFRNNICTNEHTELAEFVKLKFKECTLSKFVMQSLQLQEKLNSMKAKFEACDGNFDSSTKLLFESKKSKLIDGEQKIPEMIELSCQFDFKETCIAVDLSVGSAGLLVNPKLGSFKDFLGREVTKKLIIIDQKTLFLPDNLAAIFMQLTDLDVISSGLFEIGSKVFSNMTNLMTLNITNNKIHEIFPNTFQDLENLKILDLSNNKIEVMNANAFNGLKKLYHLNLSNNKLESIGNNFRGLFYNLTYLSLKNNRLKFVSANLISPLSIFKNLDLTDNDCIDMKHPEQSKSLIQSKIIESCIEPLQLTCDFELENLIISETFSFNGYMCKADNLFIDFPQTKISKLNGVHSNQLGIQDVTGFVALSQTIKFLPTQLAQMLPEVRMILIDRSGLNALQKNDFEGFKSLKEIFIRFNNLTLIDPETFNMLALLEILDLSSNNIEWLPPRLFIKLVQLKSLNLSDNNLQKLPAEFLLRKNKIQHFWLRNNKLEIIEIQVIRCLRKAETVDFTNNDCIDMKYEKQQNDKSFADLFTEVDVSCSPENLNY